MKPHAAGTSDSQTPDAQRFNMNERRLIVEKVLATDEQTNEEFLSRFAGRLERYTWLQRMFAFFYLTWPRSAWHAVTLEQGGTLKR